MFLEPKRFLDMIPKRDFLALSHRNSVDPFLNSVLDHLPLVFLVPPLGGVERDYRRYFRPAKEIFLRSEEIGRVETEFFVGVKTVGYCCERFEVVLL